MDRDSVRISQSSAEAELTTEDRRRAVRRVASAAKDAQDCVMLLAALGLLAEEGRAAPPRSEASATEAP